MDAHPQAGDLQPFHFRQHLGQFALAIDDLSRPLLILGIERPPLAAQQGDSLADLVADRLVQRPLVVGIEWFGTQGGVDGVTGQSQMHLRRAQPQQFRVLQHRSEQLLCQSGRRRAIE